MYFLPRRLIQYCFDHYHAKTTNLLKNTTLGKNKPHDMMTLGGNDDTRWKWFYAAITVHKLVRILTEGE